MADIFISYASEDRLRVEPLAKELKEQGWSVFWDRTILPGKNFSQVIEKAIDAAKCVVVLWSNASIKSDWVQNEAAEGAKRSVLVPVLVDDVMVPLEFRRIQAANLTDWKGESSHSGFALLLESISETIASQSKKFENEQVPKKPKLDLEQTQKVKLDEKESPKHANEIPDSIEKDTKSESHRKAAHISRIGLAIAAIALFVFIGAIGLYFYVDRQKAFSPVNSGKEQAVEIAKQKTEAAGPSERQSEGEITTTKLSKITTPSASDRTSSSDNLPVKKEESSNQDYFQFKTPPTYRDNIQVRLENRSDKFRPSIRILDANKKTIGSEYSFDPGANLEHLFAAKPSSTYYVHVSSAATKGSLGQYRLKVTALKAYDQSEPNDDIFTPKQIQFGKTIEAGIMGTEDQDFYELKVPSISGKVKIFIENRSMKLRPALKVFDHNKNDISGLKGAPNPGANLEYLFAANSNSTYYVLVRSWDGYLGDLKVGNYRLTVKEE